MGFNCFRVEKENSKCTWDLNHDLFSLILHSSISLVLKTSYIWGTFKLWPKVTVVTQKPIY